VRKNLQKSGKIKMPKKLYDYDPAAALGSQKAIAIFMADAFEK
jgi:DNA-binding phage protein